MDLRLLALSLASVQTLVYAAEPVKLCYEDTSVYPWITGDDQGLVLFEMHLVEADLGLKFEFVRLPWKRCLKAVETGALHGAIAASFNRERASWGVYPTMADGALNREWRLHTDSFHAYRRMDSAVRWSNNKFENLNRQPVAVQLGYSVGANLEEQGYTVKYAPSSADMAHMLVAGVVPVAVLQNHEAMRVMAAKPSLEKTIIRDGEPVKVADQYLLFNAAFYAAQAPLSQSIWSAIERARKSKAYTKEETRLMGDLGKPK